MVSNLFIMYSIFNATNKPVHSSSFSAVYLSIVNAWFALRFDHDDKLSNDCLPLALFSLIVGLPTLMIKIWSYGLTKKLSTWTSSSNYWIILIWVSSIFKIFQAHRRYGKQKKHHPYYPTEKEWRREWGNAEILNLAHP